MATAAAPFYSLLKRQKLSKWSPEIEDAVTEISLLIFRDFITSWYSFISPNTDFITALCTEWPRITLGLEDLIEKVFFIPLEHSIWSYLKVDLISLACISLPSILDQHLADFVVCMEKSNGNGDSGKDAEEENGKYSAEQIFLLHQPHYAMNNAESEHLYIISIVEIILGHVLKPGDFETGPLRNILEEILSSILLNLVDLLSTPQFIYGIIYQLLCLGNPGLREKYRKEHESELSRELEILKGRDHVRSMKNTSSLLDSLLQQDSLQSIDDKEGAKPKKSQRRTGDGSLRHNRSVTALVIPAGRTTVDESSHPLSQTSSTSTRSFISDESIDSLLRRRQSYPEKLRYAGESPSSTSISPISGLRPRSNAAHITKKLSHNSSSGFHETIHDPRELKFEVTPPAEEKGQFEFTFDLDSLFLFLASIYSTLTSIVYLYINAYQKIKKDDFPHSVKKEPRKQLDEKWYKFMSRFFLFVSSPSPIYLLIDTILRPLSLVLFDDIIQTTIETTVNEVISPRNIGHVISILKDVIWPNGKLISGAKLFDMHTDDLKVIIRESIPGIVRLVITEKREKNVTDQFIEMFKYKAINKRLVYSLLDMFTSHLMPKSLKDNGDHEKT